MLQRIVSLFTNYELSRKKVFAILFGLSLFLRLPFFFRDYIDRDESSFIIVAQSWVDGFLPYTQLWDLKPPVTFLFFAIIIKVFGKSFFAIRFFGSFIVALTAFFVFKIGRQTATAKVGFWAAILCVALQSMFGNVQGVMSEHISIVFFCAAFYLLLSKEKWFWYLLSGLLIGLSIMTKLNMAYPAFFLGVFLIVEGFKNRAIKLVFPKLIHWVFGMVLMIFLTALPYFLKNEFNTWWQSVVMAPLAYSSTKTHSILNVLPFLLIFLVLFGVLFGFKLLDFKQRIVQLLLAISLGVIVSFVQTGKVNGHYLIQLYPFLLLLVVMALYNLKLPKKRKFAPALVLIALLLPIETYFEYVNIVKHKIEKGTFYNGEGFTIPQYIRHNHLDATNIYFTEYHIGYWVLGVNPVTKVVTHPSNITRQEMFPTLQNPRATSMEELQYILETKRPNIIVARKNRKIYKKAFPLLNEYIDNYLLDHYKQIAVVDQGIIYERSK